MQMRRHSVASRRWQWRHACIAIADVHLVACDLLVVFFLIPFPTRHCSGKMDRLLEAAKALGEALGASSEVVDDV